jgi:predicted thioredoxin/glutaredoxin
LVKGVNRFTISQEDATELVEEAKQEVLEETCTYAAETLDASLTELLAQEEIVAQVTTEMYITEDSSIEIEQVTVQCHGAQEERIRELLGAYLGEDEVLYVETVETSSDDVASE